MNYAQFLLMASSDGLFCSLVLAFIIKNFILSVGLFLFLYRPSLIPQLFLKEDLL
jgi:hypothetical protein